MTWVSRSLHADRRSCIGPAAGWVWCAWQWVPTQHITQAWCLLDVCLVLFASDCCWISTKYWLFLLKFYWFIESFIIGLSLSALFLLNGLHDISSVTAWIILFCSISAPSFVHSSICLVSLISALHAYIVWSFLIPFDCTSPEFRFPLLWMFALAQCTESLLKRMGWTQTHLCSLAQRS